MLFKKVSGSTVLARFRSIVILKQRIFLILCFSLFGIAQAGVSLITGAVIIGGEKIYDYDLEAALDNQIKKLSASAGQVCVMTEHFIFDSGLSYSSISLLQGSLETNDWFVNEVSKDGFTDVIWILTRKRFSVTEEVLLLSIEVNDTGFISVCKW